MIRKIFLPNTLLAELEKKSKSDFLYLYGINHENNNKFPMLKNEIHITEYTRSVYKPQPSQVHLQLLGSIQINTNKKDVSDSLIFKILINSEKKTFEINFKNSTGKPTVYVIFYGKTNNNNGILSFNQTHYKFDRTPTKEVIKKQLIR